MLRVLAGPRRLLQGNLWHLWLNFLCSFLQCLLPAPSPRRPHIYHPHQCHHHLPLHYSPGHSSLHPCYCRPSQPSFPPAGITIHRGTAAAVRRGSPRVQRSTGPVVCSGRGPFRQRHRLFRPRGSGTQRAGCTACRYRLHPCTATGPANEAGISCQPADGFWQRHPHVCQ